MNFAHPWLRGFVPVHLSVGRRERILSCIGAAVGLFATEGLSRYVLGVSNPWFIAPMGASAVLLFATPASPLAQPWSVLGGNLVSALIGVAVAAQWGDSGLAAGLAVSLAITAMFYLRCLHPPGGAVALCAVLGNPAITKLGFGFAIWPVTLNSMVLLLSALFFNNLAGRRYPHLPVAPANPHRTSDPLPQARQGLSVADLEAALESHGELLDVCKEDLLEVLVEAEKRAQQRRLAGVHCRDIMSRDLVLTTPATPIHEAWQRLNAHKVKMLPVASPDRELLGVITLHDIYMAAERTKDSQDHRYVADVMTKSPRTARPGQSIADLATMFSDDGMHHLPVVDEQNVIVGIISQSDFVGALLTALK